jgi:hypothetical protein
VFYGISGKREFGNREILAKFLLAVAFFEINWDGRLGGKRGQKKFIFLWLRKRRLKK